MQIPYLKPYAFVSLSLINREKTLSSFFSRELTDLNPFGCLFFVFISDISNLDFSFLDFGFDLSELFRCRVDFARSGVLRCNVIVF